MKNCPYCEAEIPNNAKRCKHCWEVVIEEKILRQCPYCEAEVSETAKKCKYCWERLNEVDENHQNEENNFITKRTTISLGNALKMFLVIWIMFDFFSFFINIARFNPVTLEEKVRVNNVTQRLAFPEMLSVAIIYILLVVWSVKTYKILLVTNTKNLNFKSTISVCLWWIIPFISFVRPYHAVKDILKNLELKSHLNNSTSIVWWRWAIFLVWSFLSRWYLYVSGDSEITVLNIMIAIFDIIWYALLFKIIERINIAQEKYIYNTHSTVSKTSLIVWIMSVISVLFMIGLRLYVYSWPIYN